RAECRRERHINSESDQHHRHQLSAEAGDSGCVANVAASFPDDRSQHASAVERITWKQIEYRQQEISRADEKEKRSPEIEVQRRRQHHSPERDQRKQKTCCRTSDRNAKLRFRIFRLSFQTREAAEGM